MEPELPRHGPNAVDEPWRRPWHPRLGRAIAVIVSILVLAAVVYATLRAAAYEPEPARTLSIEVDEKLSAYGAWRIGTNPPLSGGDGTPTDVEVDRDASGLLHVRVRRGGRPMFTDVDVSIRAAESSEPTATARVSSHQAGGPVREWKNLGGRVLVNRRDLSGSNGEPFVIAYELTADGSGSPVGASGTVVLDEVETR